MFLKLCRYFWLVCLGVSFSAWSENAPKLTDLGVQIKQNDDAILSQIQGERLEKIVGYFAAKSPKIHKKPRKNSQFVRKSWGRNERGDLILQDFYFDGIAESAPLTSVYVLPRKRNPNRKQLVGNFHAAVFAWYRPNGLPEKIMLLDDNRIKTVYQIDENGQVEKMFHLSDNLASWLFYEHGAPKSHMSGMNLQSWYENGQARLFLDENGNGTIWHENGKLYYQNTANKVAFFHENGQIAVELFNNQIHMWDEMGHQISENQTQILNAHLDKVREMRNEILNEMKVME